MQHRRQRTRHEHHAATSNTSDKAVAARMVFAIPELMDVIARCLIFRDRVQLSMTNRLCYRTLAPLLWHSLDLIDNDLAELLLTSKDAQRLVSRNLHLVRHLNVQTGVFLHMVNNMSLRNAGQTTIELLPTKIPESATTYTAATTTAAPIVPTYLQQPPSPSPWTIAFPNITWLTRLGYRAEQRLDGDRYFLDAYPDAPDVPQLARLISTNPSLTHLNLSGCCIKSTVEISLLIQVISNLNSLKDLVLKFQKHTDDWEEVVQTLFLSLPISLETLDVDADTITQEDSRLRKQLNPWRRGSRAGRPLAKRTTSLDRLTRLRIMFHRMDVSSLLCSFLEHCPALESFHPPPWHCDINREDWDALAQAVVDCCPRLRKVESCHLLSVKIVELLPKHSLTSIIDNGSDRYTDPEEALLAVSVNHFTSLTEIRVDGCSHVGGTTFQRVLGSCVALEHFTVKGDQYSACSLRCLAEKEWVCTKLKSLEITVDLCQINLPARDLGKMPAVHEATWVLLRKFYRQLGALTEIEVLNIAIQSKEMQWLDEYGRERVAIGDLSRGGKLQRNYGGDTWSEDDDDGSAYDTADENFTLADDADASFPGLLTLGEKSIGRPGYLSLLGGLTKLRELRGWVQATTTETSKTVGQKEMEWMIEHWPRLEVIELLPSVRDQCGRSRHLHRLDLSPPHIVWFQQQRPGIHIQQDHC
ncbi:hypothetical protein EC991_005403 [Linnemannia zychae]|nr:hypothetical protein EC991_005403 [Linnemannia zychae]